MRPAHKRAGRELEPADRAVLLMGLARALSKAGLGPEALDLAPNCAHSRSGSYPSCTAICRLTHGGTRRLFCKCSKDFDAPSHRHRSGVAYEARVYEQLVSRFDGASPEYVGAYEDHSRGLAFLFLEELEGVLRVSKTAAGNMSRAAAWIGRFHRRHDLAQGAVPVFLTVYDRDYYTQWPRRALRLTRKLHGRYPWLGTVCDAFESEMVPLLLAAAQTVIHGEYYPKNILARRSTVFPVDWESTAVGPGELDLVSLTEGWPDEDKRACARSYRDARWPDGAPASHAPACRAAGMYWLLRWLGNGSYFATGKHGVRRLNELGALAGRLGWI